ncbi:MAG: FecR domain-containing protein [Alphaproteobacteria bacterium]|nr:FecR domain-containing protein [Alphaproteobacteria bacterium]
MATPKDLAGSVRIASDGEGRTAEVLHFGEGAFLRDADYFRVGSDLVLKGADGQSRKVEGFFDLERPPALVGDDGARIEPDLASLLAKVNAPILVAQAGGGVGTAIGEIKQIVGSATVTRGGQTIQLQEGTPVQQGDQLRTGAGSKVTVQFSDGTTFSLDANARMVLDRMVFDPGTKQGNSLFSVLQGAFVFVSGDIAKTDPSQMLVRTPVATIGIRGTGVGGEVRGEGFVNSFTILTGIIVLINGAATIVLDEVGESVRVTGNNQVFSDPVILTPDEIALQYGDIIRMLNQFVPPERQIVVQLDELSPHDGIFNGAPNQNLTDPDFAGQITGQNFLANFENGNGRIQLVQNGSVFLPIENRTDTAILPPATEPFGLTILGTAGSDFLVGTAGPDQIFGLDGNDTLLGLGGDDTLVGGNGNDVVNGGEGNDVLVAGDGAGDDVYDGGPGFDTIVYTSVPHLPNSTDDDMKIDLSTNTVTGGAIFIGQDQISNIEAVMAGGGDDTLIGSAEANLLHGGLGNDIIDGGAGNDTLDGGDGINTVSFASSAQGVDASLALGMATGNGNDLLSNFSHIVGSSHDDRLAGDAGDNMIQGGGGHDTLVASGGNDTLDGGDGIDLVDFSAATAGVRVFLTTPDSVLGESDGSSEGFGNDVLRGIEHAQGSAFDDTINGSNADNLIMGGAGDDILAGMNGNDTLMGGEGDDVLNGGFGADELWGGAGADTFFYDAPLFAGDTIMDFDSGVDKIQLTRTTFGNTAMAFGSLTLGLNFEVVAEYDGTNGTSTNAIGSKPNFIYDSANATLYYDSNGNQAGGYTSVATFAGTSEAPAASDVQLV